MLLRWQFMRNCNKYVFTRVIWLWSSICNFQTRHRTMTEPPLRLIGSISPLFARFFMEPIWPVLGCLTILKPFSRKEMWPGLLECKKPICSFWHLHLVSKFYQWRRAHSRFYPGFFAAIKFVPRQLWCLHSPRNSMLCDDSTEKKYSFSIVRLQKLRCFVVICHNAKFSGHWP